MAEPEQKAERPDRAPGWPRTNARSLARRRFGRLRVEDETAHRAANGTIEWTCRCRCGGFALVATHNLTSGNTLSCGCLQLERSVKANKKSGIRWAKG